MRAVLHLLFEEALHRMAQLLQRDGVLMEGPDRFAELRHRFARVAVERFQVAPDALAFPGVGSQVDELDAGDEVGELRAYVIVQVPRACARARPAPAAELRAAVRGVSAGAVRRSG
ncbi:MAG: hypothetical protein U5R48_12575 [Gammaproteobacteria bacterium]|nr:hypothetical protein [Gammaproteobacteria bacterium]